MLAKHLYSRKRSEISLLAITGAAPLLLLLLIVIYWKRKSAFFFFLFHYGCFVVFALAGKSSVLAPLSSTSIFDNGPLIKAEGKKGCILIGPDLLTSNMEAQNDF